LSRRVSSYDRAKKANKAEGPGSPPAGAGPKFPIVKPEEWITLGTSRNYNETLIRDRSANAR
jgi:hypothetical protein